MSKALELDYFRGDESEQFRFYRIPKALFTDNRYKDISAEAKVLYGLMLDRMSISLKNNWLDGDRVFVYFTLEETQELLGCAHTKAVRLFAELDTIKGIGLIERKKQGMGRPTKIFIKKFSTPSRSPPLSSGEVKTSQNGKSYSTQCQQEALTSQIGKLRLPETGSQDFSKKDGIDTYINNTDFNDTDFSSSSVYAGDFEDEEVRQLKKDIEYAYFEEEMPDKLPIIDCLTGIILALRKEDAPKYRRVLSDVDSLAVIEFLDDMKDLSFRDVRNFSAYLQRVFVEFLLKRATDLAMLTERGY